MTDQAKALKQLAELDSKLIDLIKQRAELSRSLYDGGVSVTRDSEFLSTQAHDPEVLQAIFREIESGEQKLIRPIQVAFLGTEATFTHQATLKHFGHSAKTLGQDTIADVFECVSKGRTDYGVVPVENSTEGAVRVTFDLFPDWDVQICAEIFLPIHHYMMMQPGTEVKKLYSHRQVFGQCRRWIQQNYPKCECIETSSTTEAAARAAQEPNCAALAGVLAAEKYGLDIVHRNVEDLGNNITRFLVLNKKTAEPGENDKTSIMFALRDQVGVLYNALVPFKNHDVNLTMIESRPSKSQNWEYIFFVDFEGHASDAKCAATINELREYCVYLKVLGSYPRAAR